MPLPSESILLTPPPPTPSLNVPVLTDASGNPIGYTKPILLLTDEFSVSTADEFAALMQDNHAATLFGWRTGGLGGNNTSYPAGTYSESTAGLTRAIMVRPHTVTTPDFPPTQYVENVGVRPDTEYDYMTADNLVNSGRPFVAAFSKAISDLIMAGQNQ
jgi:C-terminal processing protease CtpA/Prc